jgi:hypothetical protein
MVAEMKEAAGLNGSETSMLWIEVYMLYVPIIPVCNKTAVRAEVLYVTK